MIPDELAGRSRKPDDCTGGGISSTIGQEPEGPVGPVRNVLTPELCRTFVALVRLDGSVTATARELGLNEASVSKRLRPLARGCPPAVPRPWLAKRGKRFVPTDEGRRMLPAATEAAAGWGRFAALAAADRAAGVTVACGHEAAGGVVLAAAARFRRDHPAAAVRVAVARGRARVEGVASGRFDLALVTDTPAAVRETARRPVVVEPLAEDELVAACAARSAWAAAFDAARPVTAAEALGWPLVLPEADSAVRRRWDELLRRRVPAAAPVVAVEVGGWRVLAGYVAAAFGVGLLPCSVAVGLGSRVRIRPLAADIRPSNRVYVVRLPDGGEAGCLVAAFAAALAEAPP